MTALTREQVEAWAKLAELATPEPWEREEAMDGEQLPDGTGSFDGYYKTTAIIHPQIAEDDEQREVCDPLTGHDSDFICAARTAVPALAAAWLEQREEIKRAEQFVIGEQYTSDTVTSPIDALIEIATERGRQYESVASQLAAKDAEIERLKAEIEKERARGLVCGFCGQAVMYHRDAPTDEELQAALDHEKTCEKNPYLSQLAALRKVAEAAKSGANSMHTAITILEDYRRGKPAKRIEECCEYLAGRRRYLLAALSEPEQKEEPDGH